MKKKVKVFVLGISVLVVLVSVAGAWSLSLWFGYTVPLILHDDTVVKTPNEITDPLFPLSGLDFDEGNWKAYLILDANDSRKLKGRNCLRLTDREIMKRMREDWKMTRTGGDAATIVSRIVFLQDGTVKFSSGIVLAERGVEGLQSRCFGWAEPQTNGILLEYCSKFDPVYWPVIIL